MDEHNNELHNEFSDLDQEISRLKQELAQHSDMATQIRIPPSPSDFWGRRVDEEKKIFEKKLVLSEEEKRVMEARMEQQASQISKYHEALGELEKRFEREAKNWEERLRAKETDILLEKNRIFWEEKVREVEHENHSLLQQVARLNESITKMKDDAQIDKAKYEGMITDEKNAYDMKVNGMQQDMEALRTRTLELQNQLALSTDQLRLVKEELDNAHRDSERRITEMIEENKSLGEKMNTVIKQTDEEKEKLQLWVRNVNTGFVQKLRHYIGSLEGLARFMQERTPSQATTSYLSSVIQELEGETELHATSLKLEAYQRSFVAVDVLEGDEAALCRKIMSVTVSETKIAKPTEAMAVIAKVKPQVVLISGSFYQRALAINKRWPFLPIIIFGSFGPEVKRKVDAAGMKVIEAPYNSGDIADIVSSVARHSVARPDYWERVKNKRGYFEVSIAASILAVGLLSGYYFKEITGGLGAIMYTERPATYVPPYTNPSNIVFDGKRLWVCDWFSQSIYKHSANSKFTVEHIYTYPGKHFTAVTWHNGSMWTADSWENKVYRHNNDDDLSVAETITLPDLEITGLASDGRALYSCDTAKGQIFKHRVDSTLTIEAVYAAPGKNPCGLYYDGKNLWSVDSKTNKIYRHHMDEKLTVEEMYSIPELSQKAGMISGVTVDNGVLWVTSEKYGKIMRYPMRLAKK